MERITNIEKSLTDMNENVGEKLDKLYAEFLKSSADLSRIRNFLKNADILIVTEESEGGKEENTALTLPLRTMDEFESLEESLKNLQVQKLLVRKLTTYGGSDLKRVIHSIMNGLLDPHQPSGQKKKKKVCRHKPYPLCCW